MSVISARIRSTTPFLAPTPQVLPVDSHDIELGCYKISSKERVSEQSGPVSDEFNTYDLSSPSTSSGIHSTINTFKGHTTHGSYDSRIFREFDIVSLRDCVQGLRELKEYPEKDRSRVVTLRKHLLDRVLVSAASDEIPSTHHADVLDILLDIYTDTPRFNQACERILSDSSWLHHPRIFWKLNDKPALRNVVLSHFSDSLLVEHALAQHPTCLLFKSRLLDLMISMNKEASHIAPIVESICNTLVSAPKEPLQLKPLYASLTELMKRQEDIDANFWSLLEYRNLVRLIVDHAPNRPSITTVAIAFSMIQTGGIQEHRSPAAYRVIADALSFHYDSAIWPVLLKICCEYKFPSFHESGSGTIFGPRKRANIEAKKFLNRMISQLVVSETVDENLSLHLANLLSHPAIHFKSSICLWTFIHTRAMLVKEMNPLCGIGILNAAEKAGDKCPNFDSISRSILPVTMLNLRRYLANGNSIERVANLCGYGTISSRILDELLQHVVGTLRDGKTLRLTEIVSVLKSAKKVGLINSHVEILHNHLLFQILGNKECMAKKFWIDVLAATHDSRLAEYACDQLKSYCEEMDLDEVLVMGQWVNDEDCQEWKRRAIQLVMLEDREKELVIDLMNSLKHKKSRIQQYVEYPDGNNDHNVAAAFCGLFMSFSLGLSAAETIFSKS